MAIRKIIQIDEEKCNGCGLCVPSCAEGAIKIVDGKARLVNDQYCDGLGACLGECPQGALQVIERDAAEFDEKATFAHSSHNQHQAESQRPQLHSGSGCPGARMMVLKPGGGAEKEFTSTGKTVTQSELSQWPVQLKLVPVSAPYFQDADLLIAADCVPFAMADFHRKFLKGKALIIGCPKLDDTQSYLQKLTEIFNRNNLNSITVAHMEVPCCFGLVNLVKEAIKRAGINIPLYDATVTVNGEIKQD